MQLPIDSTFHDFVAAHKGDDPYRLRLKFHPEKGSATDLAITHLQCTAKAGHKFIDDAGENIAPEVLLSPLSIEQASSAHTAALHASLVTPGGTLLDMTCGLGIDTLSFAVKAGCKVTTCEMNPLLAAAARYNFRNQNITIVEGNSVNYLSGNTEHYDTIFIDPARRDESGRKVFNIQDCTPDVLSIMPLLKSRADKVIIKLSPMIDVTMTVQDLLPNDIYCVSGDNGECKEVLAVIDNKRNCADTLIHIVSKSEPFVFSLNEEYAAVAKFDMPKVGDILIEPYAATMKAGPFKLLCSRFGITKLHHNTHLYLNTNLTTSFPGNQYRITKINPFKSAEIKRLATERPTINVAVRNFVLSADDLAKKIKSKPGGHDKLFGATIADNSKVLIFGERIL